MPKENESITIDSKVNQEIKAQAKKEDRTYSGMIQWAVRKYLEWTKNEVK